MQRVDELEERLGRTRAAGAARRLARLDALDARLATLHPGRALAARATALDTLALRLAGASRMRLTDARARLGLAVRALDAVSPLAVLERGYAVVSQDGRVVRDAATLRAGERVAVRLGRGRFTASVDGVEADAPPDPADPADPYDPPDHTPVDRPDAP